MFPRLTAEVHIKLFLRTNSNLFIYQQEEAGKGKNRRHFSHSELESTIRGTEMEPSGVSYLPWEVGGGGGWMEPQSSAKLKVACWISQN